MDSLDKLKNIIPFSILAIGVGGVILWSSHRGLSSLDTFSKGTVFRISNGKHKTYYDYKFNTISGRFEGYNRDHRDLSKVEHILNREYVVGYNAADPEKNHLFFNMPVVSETLVDSLNICCSPQDYIDYWTIMKK